MKPFEISTKENKTKRMKQEYYTEKLSRNTIYNIHRSTQITIGASELIKNIFYQINEFMFSLEILQASSCQEEFWEELKAQDQDQEMTKCLDGNTMQIKYHDGMVCMKLHIVKSNSHVCILELVVEGEILSVSARLHYQYLDQQLNLSALIARYFFCGVILHAAAARHDDLRATTCAVIMKNFLCTNIHRIKNMRLHGFLFKSKALQQSGLFLRSVDVPLAMKIHNVINHTEIIFICIIRIKHAKMPWSMRSPANKERIYDAHDEETKVEKRRKNRDTSCFCQQQPRAWKWKGKVFFFFFRDRRNDKLTWSDAVFICSKTTLVMSMVAGWSGVKRYYSTTVWADPSKNPLATSITSRGWRLSNYVTYGAFVSVRAEWHCSHSAKALSSLMSISLPMPPYSSRLRSPVYIAIRHTSNKSQANLVIQAVRLLRHCRFPFPTSKTTTTSYSG
ncbi:hypothetical protein VP01_111g4 [Puccinia sorghi]|uniref:Uncharacterized protein n=1 Tax=Puccinia sorghi TaxID=27349 RepID=A0A0L6VSM3_9BASI|nr:hypothetical protein VP01_111g4 [Puccinia sorghi]